ncbi:hypothetical protein CGGC5_v008072 [Colletotrichum fructicola Nara gc5]|uniref:Uncharacterized protein n=1 Tax=Colletotrichum fructicola (strain Nara gc5) TaxID=1213859 RepID=A0A7J6J7C0_COLFN|nr:hypothetical protein CGGC5_v008072 [Colletotrichum fructicola Nara gc5]
MSGAAYCPLEENRDEGQATDIGSQGHDDDPSNQSSTSIGALHYSAENTGTNAPCAEEKKTMDANEAFNHENIATWRPIWLQPIILASFSGLFLVFSILLLLISLKAKRSDGLFETWQGFRLAWRFGPTAVLTIVCAFWTRVEQQALRTTLLSHPAILPTLHNILDNLLRQMAELGRPEIEGFE